MKISISRVIRKLSQCYYDSLTKEYIRKPISYSLYQTWKYFDNIEEAREANDNDCKVD